MAGTWLREPPVISSRPGNEEEVRMISGLQADPPRQAGPPMNTLHALQPAAQGGVSSRQLWGPSPSVSRDRDPSGERGKGAAQLPSESACSSSGLPVRGAILHGVP